jgi:hypothetical protein
MRTYRVFDCIRTAPAFIYLIPSAYTPREHFAKMSFRRFFRLRAAWRALTPMDSDKLYTLRLLRKDVSSTSLPPWRREQSRFDSQGRGFANFLASCLDWASSCQLATSSQGNSLLTDAHKARLSLQGHGPIGSSNEVRSKEGLRASLGHGSTYRNLEERA